MSEPYVPVADAETMLTVLNTMDNGVFELLLRRYGGAGIIEANRYRYAIASWYLNAIAQNPGYYTQHSNINTHSDQVGSIQMTCQCGDVVVLGAGSVGRFSPPEWIVFHQIDFFWQNNPPKNRPQWYDYQD